MGLLGGEILYNSTHIQTLSQDPAKIEDGELRNNN